MRLLGLRGGNMEKKSEKMEEKCECKAKPGSSEAVYGLGFLGALVYYLTTATSIWLGILGVIKAILWPAFLVYSWLKFLGM
jgi:hypothetical protein